MSNEDLYVGREQTMVKHFILSKYLERFAHIVGTFADTICYVDCFSGPWNVRSDKFKDSSFAIALGELRKARASLAERGRKLNLHCFFLEKDPAAFAKLKEFADGVKDATIEVQNAELECSVGEIVKFVRRGGARAFPFIFIDPTGWTGFEMATISPLLRLNPGEVLINFMTSHIRRFINSAEQQTQESFARLFGSSDFREKVAGLSQQDREDAALQEYIQNVTRIGNFSFASKAVVLHPEINRTHFHLIYATRDLKGLEVFKEAEKKAMEMMESARAEAHQRKQIERTGQGCLFDSLVMHNPNYYNCLRERYLDKSRQNLHQTMQAHTRMSYDDAWVLALSEPLTWESDLKEWIQDWRNDGMLEIEGMEPRQKVPRLKANNYLIWKPK